MTPPPPPVHSGRRVLAFLFSLLWVTPLLVCIGISFIPHSLVLLFIPLLAGFASRLDGKPWLLFTTLTLLLFGALFGHTLEGPEGAIWGSLIGLASGLIAGRASLWLLREIPGRWGLVAGWSLLGIALTLTPLLLAIRLFAGRLDDDDSAFILLAIAYGVFHSFRKQWWPLPFDRPHLLRALAGWLRFWLSPRALPWVAAFLICGLTTGGMGPSFESTHAASLTIHVLPRSWVWPCGLLAASLASIIASRRPTPANALLRIASAVVALLVAGHLVSLARHHAEITPRRLHFRFGLRKNIELDRTDLTAIETGLIRGRRVFSSYPILVTRHGKRLSLRGLPLDHEVRTWLETEWQIPSSPAPVR